MRRRIVAASHIIVTTITWLHCLGLLLRVLVVLGLNATLKLIRPSSSSSTASNLLNSWRADFGMFYSFGRKAAPQTRSIRNSTTFLTCASVGVSLKISSLQIYTVSVGTLNPTLSLAPSAETTPLRAPQELFSGPNCGSRRASGAFRNGSVPAESKGRALTIGCWVLLLVWCYNFHENFVAIVINF